MKRTLFKAVPLLLMGGAIVNLAVAWACGMWATPDTSTMVWGTSERNRSPVMPASGWGTHMWRVWGTGIEMIDVREGPGHEFGPHYQALDDVWPSWIAFDDIEFAEHLSGGRSATHFAQGWPMRALWCNTDYVAGFPGGWSVGPPAFVPASFLGWQPAIAFRPLWSGFVINTLFYAAMMWLMFFAPFTLRRWRRVKRGLCAKCGYDLRASHDRCAECGDKANST